MKNKKFYSWLVVALLWVVALLNYMDRQMLSTMQDAMKLDIVELQKAEAFGALMAVFLWIYGIVSPFAGVVADRVSRKKLVVGSLFVCRYVPHGLRLRLYAALLVACAYGCQRGVVYTFRIVAHRRLA
jgi:sugar phosphate permease